MSDSIFIDEDSEVYLPPPMFFVYDGEFPPEDLAANENEIHLWFSEGETFSLVGGAWIRYANIETLRG